MKSIKPIPEGTSSTLIATDVANDLRQQINTLSNTVANQASDIADIEEQLAVNNTTKQSGTFDTLNARNANISNKANIKEIETEEIDTDEISSTHASIHNITGDDATFDHIGAADASFTCANIENVSTCNIATECIQADTVNANTSIACSGSFNQVNAPNATFNELNATCVNLNGTLDLDSVNATCVNATNLEATEARADALNAAILKSPYFYNRNKVFVEDETDANEFVLLGDPTDSSNTNNDARYIELPAITGGWYRIVVKKPNGNYFAVTFINTETAPIVQYSKDESGDIQALYYDALTNKLYVKTYATGWIFWTNDSKNQRPAPQTYTELPADSSLATTFQYTATGKNRLVIMGDGTADYGLAIQGLLEAKVIKDDTRFHNLFFIGDSWQALKNFADRYLTYEDHNGVKHYMDSETAGYLFHWKKEDDIATTEYRSEDGADIEALEKIAYDGTKVTLTLDTKHGQDEIEIDGTGKPAGYYPYTGPLNNTTAYVKNIIDAVDKDVLNYELHSELVPADLNDVILVVFGEPSTTGPALGTIWYPIDDGENLRKVSGSSEDVSYELLHTQPAYFVRTGDFIEANFEGLTQMDEHQWPTDHDYYADPIEHTPVQGTMMVGGNSLTWKDAELSTDIYSYQEAETQEDLLPFIISITLSSYSWDIAMNDSVWNSYSNERE